MSSQDQRKKQHQEAWNHISAVNRKLEKEIQMLRVLKISAVMDELECCRRNNGLGATIGELDQLTELNRLLFHND